MIICSKFGIVLLVFGISFFVMVMDFGQVMLVFGGVKVQGLVGEQVDGYFGVVSNSGQVVDIVVQINVVWCVEYQKVVNSSGVLLVDVEVMVGKKVMERIFVGQYVQVGGKWVKKQCEGFVSVLGCCFGCKGWVVFVEFFLL